MQKALKGFICADETHLFVGDPLEMMIFLQNTCMAAGIDPYIEDLDALISTLDEQVKVRFSSEIQILPFDADTMMPANRKTEELYLVVTPIQDITVH